MAVTKFLILVFLTGLYSQADVLLVTAKENKDPNTPSISGVTFNLLPNKTIEAVYSGGNIESENLGLISDISADFGSSGAINFRSKKFPDEGSWHITINFGSNSSIGLPSSQYSELIAKYFQWLRLGLATSLVIKGGLSATPAVTVTVN